MERHLLFDSGCLVCSGLAQEIEQAARGWLSVRSLRSAEMQQVLDQAQPGWKWEPMLIERDGDTTRIYRGLKMRLHIVGGVGAGRALAIAKLVHKAGVAMVDANEGRRGFLKGSAAITAGLILGLTAAPASARETVEGDLAPLGKEILLHGAQAEKLRQRALASRDVENILRNHAISDAPATVYQYATSHGAPDWSVTFQAAGGGIITYMVRPKSQIRTQAIYERDQAFVAMSYDGILSKTTNLALGKRVPVAGVATMDICFDNGCGVEYVDFCERCCSTCSGYRTVEKACCMCRYPGGGYYTFGCRAYAYGPCGIC